MEGAFRPISHKLLINEHKMLGKGSTGNVYQGRYLGEEEQKIAIKVIPLSQINNQVTAYLLQCQLQALKSISLKPNNFVVQLKDIVVCQGNCYIATELLEGGTLKQLINKNKKLSYEFSLRILAQLLKGYCSLLENSIIHRDLKPDNILLTSDLAPKIIDFGYCIAESVKRKPQVYYNVGSPRYMAPQAYKNNIYSEKSDVWALGVIFYEMLTGTTFDVGKNVTQTFQSIKKQGIPIPSSLNAKSRNILKNMLMLDPHQRASCAQILQQIQKEDVIPITIQRRNMNFLQIPNRYRNFNERPERFSLSKDPRSISLQSKQKPRVNLNRQNVQKRITRTSFNFNPEKSDLNNVCSRKQFINEKSSRNSLINESRDLRASLDIKTGNRFFNLDQSFDECSYKNLRVSINFGNKKIQKSFKIPLKKWTRVENSPQKQIMGSPRRQITSPEKVSPLQMSKYLSTNVLSYHPPPRSPKTPGSPKVTFNSMDPQKKNLHNISGFWNKWTPNNHLENAPISWQQNRNPGVRIVRSPTHPHPQMFSNYGLQAPQPLSPLNNNFWGVLNRA